MRKKLGFHEHTPLVRIGMMARTHLLFQTTIKESFHLHTREKNRGSNHDLTHSQVFLIIPAFNEAENMPVLMQRLMDLNSQLPNDPYFQLRVILVDNGSTDHTADIARHHFEKLCVEKNSTREPTQLAQPSIHLFVVTEQKRGYGAACLRGIEEANAQLQAQSASAASFGSATCVTYYDADMADDLFELPNMWQAILDDEQDMVIASRVKNAEPGSLSPTQRFGNWLSCSLIRLITGWRYTDLGPMRAISWETLQALKMKDLTWGWTVEMQFKAARSKIRIHEIHTAYRCRKLGKSKISGSLIGSAKAGFKILLTIAQLSLRRSQ